MPHYSAAAIANEFLKRMPEGQAHSQIVIQKLTYIAHGWCLAIVGEPLVDEPPQAWDNGPVFRSIWDRFKMFGFGSKSGLLEGNDGRPFEAHLNAAEADIIDRVWKRYGHLSGRALSDMTHQPGTPWWKAYFDRGRNAELDRDEIRAHFVKLALAGREQTPRVEESLAK